MSPKSTSPRLKSTHCGLVQTVRSRRPHIFRCGRLRPKDVGLTGMSRKSTDAPGGEVLQHRFRLPANKAMKKTTSYKWTNGALPTK